MSHRRNHILHRSFLTPKCDHHEQLVDFGSTRAVSVISMAGSNPPKQRQQPRHVFSQTRSPYMALRTQATKHQCFPAVQALVHCLGPDHSRVPEHLSKVTTATTMTTTDMTDMAPDLPMVLVLYTEMIMTTIADVVDQFLERGM